MKKKAFLRGLVGFPIGISIYYVITIIFSLIYGNGYYYPCNPNLIISVGSEINAVLVQFLLCGILGFGFSATSIIWNFESWSLIKQTSIYFSIISLLMFPIAYISHWMEHSIKGFLLYFSVFILIFIIIWLITYLIIKNNVKKMNNQLNNINKIN